MLGATCAWSQVEPSASGGEVTLDESHMMTPPAVSGISYPNVGTAESRSNYLSGGVGFSGAYVDNVLAGELTKPVPAEIYSVMPDISLDQVTPRYHRSFKYAAGFTFYDPTSELNEVDQSATINYEYRATQRITFLVQDTVVQASNAFGSNGILTGGSLSGSTGTSDVITPFGKRLMNDGSVGMTYQFGLNAMVGVEGETSLLDYATQAANYGLSNSLGNTGSAFYSRRISRTQYIGAMYLFRHISTTPIASTINTNTSSIFYTLFLKNGFSLSLVGGGEYYDSTETGIPAAHAWVPALTASVGWQARHGSISGRYSRSVTGGGGLLGSYTSTSGDAAVALQFARNWSASASANYGLNENENAVQFPTGEGGHSISGTASIERTIHERVGIQVGYGRIHESYTNIAPLTQNPDSNRVFGTVSYHFSKPLGR